MRILLTLTFFIAFSTLAYAQDNKIIVINKDGTVSTIDAEPSAAKPKETAVAPPRKVDVAPATPVKPVKKPEAKKQAAKKETKTQKAAAPKKKKAVSAEKKSNKKKAIPAAPVRAPEQSSPRIERLGPQMTPEDAIRITLHAAPPARSVNAYPVNYKGLHAYQVVFATEDGDRSVFVDRESGRIVK